MGRRRKASAVQDGLLVLVGDTRSRLAGEVLEEAGGGWRKQVEELEEALRACDEVGVTLPVAQGSALRH